MSTQYGYGFFPGGDPRDFRPDPECSTDAERDAHATDCAAWDTWEQSGFEGEPPEPSVRYGHEHRVNADGSEMRVLFSGYGLGSYTYEDDEPEPPPCDGSPQCQCNDCVLGRFLDEEEALTRHREATRSSSSQPGEP